MSRIDDLIAVHCPKGVECRSLSEVARIRNGRDYRGFDAGDVPVYGTGGVMARIDTAAHAGPSVLIPRKGSLKNIYFVDEPFWTGDTIFYTEIDDTQIVPKFFFYLLVSMRLEDLNQAGGVPSLTQTMLNRLRIPLPPLEVQREIVRVLDLFQSLEAELEAELEARRRQYAHYRDSLLDFTERGVRWMTLGEVGELVRGNGMPKSDFVDDGVGCIHYGQIYTRYGTSATTTLSFVQPEKAAKLAQVEPGDVIITNTSENLDDVCKAVAWLGDSTIVTGGHATVLKHQENSMYLAYYFQTRHFQVEKNRHATGTKVIDVSAKSLAKIRIPVPSLDHQQEIVAILDKFDALVNDLSIGLPAELAARRSQYEYYRDRLLTFEEAA